MLFDPIAEEVVRETVGRLSDDERDTYGSKVMRAVDFLEGRQVEHTRSELSRRFKEAQTVVPEQPIEPVVIPIVERYIAEAATAYNHDVRRYFVNDEGKEDDSTRSETDGIKRMTGDASYDETMHRVDQLRHALRPAPPAIWYQVKRGQLRPAIQLPHNIYPVVPETPAFVDAADPDDYDGFVVEIFPGAETRSGGERTFAFITNAQVHFYTGTPEVVDEYMSGFDNPLTWPQKVDDPTFDAEGNVTGFETKEVQDAGLNPLTFWHHSKPFGTLLPNTDTDLVHANVEINVAISSLFDTIAYQGHATPVYNLSNPTSPKARRRVGVRFPQVLDINEAFNMVSAATSYSEQVAVLEYFVRLLAIAKRMSPNDFSVEGTAAISGFAKVVDSLPKLEARGENIQRLTSLETRVAAPRLIAIGIREGYLTEAARKMTYRVEFADVEFPTTEDEKTKKIDRLLKHNMTSVAKELARKHGTTVEEAIEMIKENREQNGGASQPDGQEQRQPAQRLSLAERIAGARRRE